MPICLVILACLDQVARLTLPFGLPLTPAFPFLHCSTLLTRQIKLSSRLRTDKNNIWCMLSVDGIDFVIQEPSDFSSGWYSHKSNGPGLRYKIAVSIVGGNICWTNGPFPAGKINDLSIFRRGLMKRLGPNEFVEADRGYEGQPDKVRLPFEAQNKDEIHRKGKSWPATSLSTTYFESLRLSFSALVSSNPWRPTQGSLRCGHHHHAD